MIYIVANLAPILGATLLGLLVGAAYRLVISSSEFAGPHPVRLLIVAALAEFWLAAILAGALILAPIQANGWTIAIGTAVVIWLGFVVPVLLVSYSARGIRPLAMLFDCAHWLIVMVGQAVVLAIIGLVRP